MEFARSCDADAGVVADAIAGAKTMSCATVPSLSMHAKGGGGGTNIHEAAATPAHPSESTAGLTAAEAAAADLRKQWDAFRASAIRAVGLNVVQLGVDPVDMFAILLNHPTAPTSPEHLFLQLVHAAHANPEAAKGLIQICVDPIPPTSTSASASASSASAGSGAAAPATAHPSAQDMQTQQVAMTLVAHIPFAIRLALPYRKAVQLLESAKTLGPRS